MLFSRAAHALSKKIKAGKNFLRFFAVIKDFSNFANVNSLASPQFWHEVANAERCATYKEVFAERFGFDCFERLKFKPQDKGIAELDTTG